MEIIPKQEKGYTICMIISIIGFMADIFLGTDIFFLFIAISVFLAFVLRIIELIYEKKEVNDE